MNEREFQKTMQHIVAAIESAGYDPYTQLYGYLQTGNVTFITRRGNARDMIGGLDKQSVWEFTMALNEEQ